MGVIYTRPVGRTGNCCGVVPCWSHTSNLLCKREQGESIRRLSDSLQVALSLALSDRRESVRDEETRESDG